MSINKPLVSIITPCYNSEKYIGRYLDKILEQTYDSIELVLVNDGSTDNTDTIIQSYRNKIYERGYQLNYTIQENGGIGSAVNTGLKKMRGQYFCWCDSDNFFDEYYIDKNINFLLRNPEYGAVRCDGYIVYDKDINTPIKKMSIVDEGYERDLFIDSILERNFHFGCTMIKTEDFELSNNGREIYPSREGQNWQIMLPVFHDCKVGYINECLFYFVFRNDSISNAVSSQGFEAREAQKLEHRNIILQTLKRMELKNYKELEEIVAIKYYGELLAYAYTSKEYKECIKYSQLKRKLVKLSTKEKVKYLLSRIKQSIKN